MAAQVRARVVDGIAVVRLENGAVNLLDAALRSALDEALATFVDDAQVRAIVLGAEGRVFSAGTDLREVQQGAVAPKLSDICARIEGAPKPVVAALQGAALAAGAEVALAAHYRVAGRAATLGLPNVALGLPPEAGASQRLPRIVGPKVALQMLTGGRPVNEMIAQRLGLFDALVSGDVIEGAVRFAKGLLDKGQGPRPARQIRDKLREGDVFAAEVSRARRRLNGQFVKTRIIDCVEAAVLLPYSAAMVFEAEAFEECRMHPDSRCLRHLVMAERQVPESLMVRGRDSSLTLTPKGQTVVARLYAAQDRAIISMVSGGITEAEIDGAMVDYGFAAGPFGRRDPGKGAKLQSLMRRIVAALMAEGARCQEQGLVPRFSDIDALAVHGMGFPRFRGGPMKAAQIMGLLALSRDMSSWVKEDQVWDAPETLGRAVLEKRGFAALD